MNSLFTVGFVNYKTSLYMETQLRIYEQFAGEEVKIIIADTSNVDEEFAEINRIVEKSSLSIQTIQLRLDRMYGSESHGMGLQSIYELVDTKYFITQDPDFFWVKPKFLTFLKTKLQNHVVVGALHPSKDWNGKPWFHVAGAAYDMDVLREVGSDFRYNFSEIGKDTGWRVHENLKDRPYYYFIRQSAELPIGNTYNDILWEKHTDGQQVVAYHLQRGSFEMQSSVGLRLAQHGKRERREKLRTSKASQKWQENRKKACEFFWQEINKANR